MSQICRLCLKTNNGAYNSLETEQYKTQITALIPEVDINIVDSPVICSYCINILLTAHTFKINCLRIEKQLKNYMTVEGKIDLHDIVSKLNEEPEESWCDMKVDVEEMLNCEEVISIKDFKQEEDDTTQEKDKKQQPYKAITCKLCKTVLLNNSEYNKHIEAMHADLICPICKKLYSNPSNLQLHKKKHDKLDLHCPACGLNASSKKTLEEHLLAHMAESRFKCKQCRLSFPQKDMLNTHMQTVHLNTPCVCEICGKSFDIIASYKVHMTTHQKNFVCKVCGYRFRNISLLKAHEKRHAGIKDSVCEVCGKEVCDNQALKRHLRIHTGQMPYECPICHKKFNTNFNKKIHYKSCLRRNGGEIGQTSIKSE